MTGPALRDDLTGEDELPERFNLTDYYLDARLHEGRGDRVAIIEAATDRRTTYAELAARVNRLANRLVAEGVRAEDRVLIALPDGLDFATAFFAVLKCGAVVCMVNPELPADDYPHYLAYTKAACLITTPELRARVGEERLWSSGHLEACFAGLPALDGERDSFEATTGPDDVAIWLFTSGSTGKPKAAVHMHRDFAWNTERYARHVLEMSEADVTLGVPKLFFGYATGSNLMFPLRFGGCTVLFPEKATPAGLLDLIERYRPTVLTSVPTMIGKMIAEPGAAGRDLASLRLSISAGEALPEELYHRWKRTFGSEILDGIGSAELFHIYISNRLGQVRPGSLGQLVPGYQARIVDDDDRDVPEGELGTLMVKGGSAAMCYWGARQKSRETFYGDWVRSSDKFRRDAEGFYYYGGRADDLLKVGGIFVAPTEVEGVLMEHADVLECVVVGYEEDGLTKAKAIVVPKTGVAGDEALAAALVAHARARLVAYKVPRKIEFRAELPRNDRGKIARREVR